MRISALGSNHFIRVAGVASLALGTFIAVACADDPKPPIDGSSSHTGGSRNTGGTDNPGGAGNTGGSNADGGSSNTGGNSADGGAAGAGGEGLGGETATGGTGGGSGGTTGGGGSGGTSSGGDSGTGGMGGAGPEPVNLIANGTFEVNAAGWSTWSGEVLHTTARAHSGTGSIVGVGPVDPEDSTKRSPRPGNAPIATALFASWAPKVVQAGHTYAASMWVSVVGGTSTVKMTRILKCVTQGTIETYAGVGNSASVPDGEWVELTGSFMIPADCEVSEVQLYAEGPAEGIEFYVDDVTLYDEL